VLDSAVVNRQVLLLSILLLALLPGCATTDYRGAAYYRETIQRIDAGRPHADQEPSPLLAGAAKVEITPPVGMPLQGFGSRRGEPSKGVHDPLHARVLVLKNEAAQLVIVSCDLMGVTRNLTDAVFAKASRRMPLRKREFLLLATHTHSGAGGLSDRFALQFVGGRFRPQLFAATTDKIAAAIVEAANSAQPARVEFAKGEVEGINKNRSKCGGPVDRELKVMRVAAADGKPLAWLVNFAAHPTVFGANWEFSADFPGYLCRELEADGSVALFANGNAGDLNIQSQNDASKEAKAERVGKALAGEARRLVAEAGKDTASLALRRADILLPPVRIRLDGHAFPSWIGNCIFPREVPMQLARVDRTLFVAVPVELNAEVGLGWKQAAAQAGYDLFILGYANDYIGYVVPERTYPTSCYEARTSFYGSKLDSYLTEAFVRMLERLP
jgi:neutral ceramidase